MLFHSGFYQFGCPCEVARVSDERGFFPMSFLKLQLANPVPPPLGYEARGSCVVVLPEIVGYKEKFT